MTAGTDQQPGAVQQGRVLIVLVLLGALFFIPGLGKVHLFDWDEANFAEASREMIVRGDWLRVTIDYQPFYQKPPLFFWLQALSMKAWGVNEFAARFVNALCGIATLAAVFTVGSRLFGVLFGLLWALAFAGSFLPHLFFRSGIIDPVFNLLIFSGIAVVARAFLIENGKPRTGLFALAGTLIGLAVLAKGPVALLVVCLTVAVYWAAVRFRKLFGFGDVFVFFACTAAVSLSFFGAETLAHGTVFIKNFIAYQVKLFSTNESGHGGPFFYHLLALLFGCFPASFFAAWSFSRRAEENDAQKTFSRLMIVLFWVVLVLFSIVKTKTVLYSSLAYFPVTYLAALFLWNVLQGKRSLTKLQYVLFSIFAGVVCLAIALFPVIMMHKELIIPLIRDNFAVACLEKPVRWTGFEFLLGTGYACALAIAIFLIAKKNIVPGSAALFGASALCLFLFLFMFAPKMDAYAQGGPVAFYREHGGSGAYVRALYKSYIDKFYGRKGPDAHPSSYDREWLLRGPIDRPVYFVAKATQSRPWDDPALVLVKLKSEYGFVYYRRDMPGNASSSK